MADDIFIAMPVYRGVALISEAVRAIREQTYPHFRVVMSVDGDDDPTVGLCRTFTEDPRFELVVQPIRLGWPGNFNWLVRRCDREFFCYWQQDDLASTGYLRALHDEMVAEPNACVAYTDVQWFGSRFERESTHSLLGSPTERVLEQIELIHFPPLRGLVRAAMLPDGPHPIPVTPNGSLQQEFVYLTELASRGTFHRVTSAMYFKRAHPENVHNGWLNKPCEVRRTEWIAMGIGMLQVARHVVPVEHHPRLLGTILDRLAIQRPGRGFFYRPNQTREDVAMFVQQFLLAAAIEASRDILNARAAVPQPHTGFERPIHPWIMTALDIEVHRSTALAALVTECQDRRVELPIAAGSPGLAMLGSGWSTPEPWGVWTDGPEAILQLPADVPGTIELQGIAFVPKGPVHLRVTVDEDPVMCVEIADDRLQSIVIEIARSSTRPPRMIRLELPDAISPLAAGISPDARELGFGLTHVVFHP